MAARATSETMRAPTRVVVIDDSSEVRYLLATIMEMDGCFEIVGEADNATAGMSLVSEVEPDLVLVDLHLGRRDGTWLIKKLRSRDSRAAIAVVTGSSVEHEHEAALAAGADSVHNKMSMTSTMVEDLAATVAMRAAIVAA